MKRGNSGLVFAVLCAASAGALAAYFTWAKVRTAVPAPAPEVVESVRAPDPEPAPAPPSEPAANPVPAVEAAPVKASGPAATRLYFRHTSPDGDYGKLAYADLPDVSRRQFPSSLHCEVVHFSSGNGICLAANRGVFTTYKAHLFDGDFVQRFVLPLEGIPSRTRVAPNGKIAAATIFVTGHSYASVDFSTLTQIIDLETGKVAADMESFQVTRGGKPFRAQDFNFWGVTFAPDSKRFYCTLSSDRKHYLIEGDVTARKAAVLHENVECPSLSPDARRIAYKKRFIVDGKVVWQLHTLDVATLKETPLGEKRNVDDQLEWLDNGTVLYALPSEQSGASTDIWRAAADGSSAPRLFLRNAYSPAVVY